MQLEYLVLLPFLGAVAAALCGKRKQAANLTAIVVTLAAFAGALWCAKLALGGAGLACGTENVVGLGLHFSLNGFRALWIVLITFAFSMSSLMVPEYLGHGHAHARYQTATLLTLCGTLGVFLAADLFTLFVFFEMMSLSSWLWVIHEETEGAKYAANTYLAVAVIGGLVMLMGLFVLYGMTGTLSIEALAAFGFDAAPGWLVYLAGGLMLFGFGAKAGLFPLHFWLPMAHPVAPAPSSALLSGVLTKCGVYGMLLLAVTMFAGDRLWGEVILALGVVTMVLGAVLALCSVDLKRTLACSSVSQIGFITVGVGLMSLLGQENLLAVRGTMLHMVNHTLIKLVLFLAAGVFAMNRGTLDLNRLRGAGRGNLPLMLAFLTGAYSVAGIPGGSGYLSKTMLHEGIVEYTEVLESAAGGVVMQLRTVEWLFLLSGGLTLAYMLKLFWTLFIAHPLPGNNEPLRMGAGTTAALAVPSALLWALGLAPHALTDRALDFAQPFLNPEPMAHSLAYFSLTNLSGACISIAAGLIAYFLVARTLLMRSGEHINVIPAWCDLERNVYRPLLLRVLPAAAGLVCRLVDNSLDGLVVLLRRTVLANLGRPKRPVAGLEITDTLGRLADSVLWLINHTVRRKKPIEHRSFVYSFAEYEREAVVSTRLITASMSFGLLLACIGLVLTLLYLLV